MDNVYSVTQVSNYIKLVFKDDVLLNGIAITGEISNFKEHSSGNLFFSIKDENALLNCVMYSSNIEDADFLLENGIKVNCYGNISLYEKTGQYQLNVKQIEPCGKGDLYLEFEKLKLKLGKQGFFEQEFKKEVPQNPSCVAVITSETGAVFHDIINISLRRNPNVKIVLIPTLVQGTDAKEQIVQAIEDVNDWGKADTIILARGGGSIEDLWAFNEEEVALAIFNSNTPIISAIGHEIDFTISDFVSDFRAPTPSAAAEIAIPEVKNLKNIVSDRYNKINDAINQKILTNKIKVSYSINKDKIKNFYEKLNSHKNNLDAIKSNLNFQMISKVKEHKFELENKIQDLENKSPINILKKGYTLVYDEKKAIVSSKEKLKKDDVVIINFYDGNIKAKIVK